MATNPFNSSVIAPDRLFARTAGLALAAGLTVAAGATLSLDNASRRQTQMAQIALDSQDQSRLARQIADDLDRLSALEPGAATRPIVRAALGARTEALAASERALRAAETGEAPGPSPALAKLERIARDLAVPITPLQAAALETEVTSELLPWLETRSRRLDATARDTFAAGRSVLRTTLALQIAGLIAVMLGLVWPAMRKMRAWVRQTDASVTETRFRMLHDAVTQMPNAAYLEAHLARLCAGEKRARTQTAVLRIDLDKYDLMRRTLGQRAGAEIIALAAKRIQNDMRQGDFAAHLGHDDFVVVASGLEDGNSAAGIAQRIQASLAKSFAVTAGTRQLSCSIGVTLLSDDEADVERILGNAELALSEAQAAGHGQVRYFRESQRREVERRETLYAELVHGLETGEIAPYFQPQIDLATGALTGFEALVRWHHPRQGLLSPGAFLDFAEQADLADRLGEVVLARSLAALRAWDAAGLVVPKVGVNFAMGQLRDPRLIEKIKWEVESADIDPSRLAVEVLETVLIKSDADMMVRNLQGLASVGFQIELDDFGTGHASIANLRRFRVDCVKIDRSFVFGIETSIEQQKLTASMVALAQALGIRTLAEGIESVEAVSVLRELGCDRGQGYVIAKPMSLQDTFSWLTSFHPTDIGAGVAESPHRRDPNSP